MPRKVGGHGRYTMIASEVSALCDESPCRDTIFLWMKNNSFPEGLTLPHYKAGRNFYIAPEDAEIFVDKINEIKRKRKNMRFVPKNKHHEKVTIMPDTTKETMRKKMEAEQKEIEASPLTVGEIEKIKGRVFGKVSKDMRYQEAFAACVNDLIAVLGHVESQKLEINDLKRGRDYINEQRMRLEKEHRRLAENAQKLLNENAELEKKYNALNSTAIMEIQYTTRYSDSSRFCHLESEVGALHRRISDLQYRLERGIDRRMY